MVMQEEKGKMSKAKNPAESFGTIPNDAALRREEKETEETDPKRVKKLEEEVMDLKITNRAKDYFIAEFQKEREAFAEERHGYVEQLISANRKVGELETKLLQLGAPKQDPAP